MTKKLTFSQFGSSKYIFIRDESQDYKVIGSITRNRGETGKVKSYTAHIYNPNYEQGCLVEPTFSAEADFVVSANCSAEEANRYALLAQYDDVEMYTFCLGANQALAAAKRWVKEQLNPAPAAPAAPEPAPEPAPAAPEPAPVVFTEFVNCVSFIHAAEDVYDVKATIYRVMGSLKKVRSYEGYIQNPLYNEKTCLTEENHLAMAYFVVLPNCTPFEASVSATIAQKEGVELHTFDSDAEALAAAQRWVKEQLNPAPEPEPEPEPEPVQSVIFHSAEEKTDDLIHKMHPNTQRAVLKELLNMMPEQNLEELINTAEHNELKAAVQLENAKLEEAKQYPVSCLVHTYDPEAYTSGYWEELTDKLLFKTIAEAYEYYDRHRMDDGKRLSVVRTLNHAELARPRTKQQEELAKLIILDSIPF